MPRLGQASRHSARCAVAKWRSSALIDPHFLYMNEAGIENVFGVAVLRTTFFGATGVNHPLHHRAGHFHVLGWQTNGSHDQQHDASVKRTVR